VGEVIPFRKRKLDYVRVRQRALEYYLGEIIPTVEVTYTSFRHNPNGTLTQAVTYTIREISDDLPCDVEG
jgi:hypothetical protein